MADPLPTVVTLETELFFAIRIEDVIRAMGARPVTVADADALWAELDRWPALALLDLAAAAGQPWAEVVRRAKTLPHTKAIPIIAFGSHVDTDALRAARAAGCDHAWARSKFMAELPGVLEGVLRPPVRLLEGWDAPPPPGLVAGIAQFNAGAYWECHETLEALWRAEPRPIRDLYQGILQIGVAFHHLRAGNFNGAVKLLRRGLPRLAGLPELCQGVPVQELAGAARAVHDAIVQLGPARIGEYDGQGLPRIKLQG